MANQQNPSINEIDLLPYFLSIWKFKNFLIGGFIIGILLGLGISTFLIPKRYGSHFTLIFRGNEDVKINKQGNLVPKHIISSSETLQLLQRYKSLLKENPNNSPLYQNITNIDFPLYKASLTYPLFIEFTLKSTDDFEIAAADVLSYLRNNEYVYEKVEQRRQFIKSKLFSYRERIKKIEAESDKIAKIDLTQYSNLQIELITLKDEEANLAYQLSDLKSYTYVIKPYLLNEGKPVSPNILLFSALGGITVVLGILIFVFVKTGLAEYHRGRNVSEKIV